MIAALAHAAYWAAAIAAVWGLAAYLRHAFKEGHRR